MSLRALMGNSFIINIDLTPRRRKKKKIPDRNNLNFYVHVIRIRLQIEHGTFLYFFLTYEI